MGGRVNTAGKEVPAHMEAKLKKEKGNEAVRQFRIRQKEKELAEKERAQRLRKENMEMEIRVASYQQELDFLVAVVKAHTEADGDAFLNDDPSLREILHQQKLGSVILLYSDYALANYRPTAARTMVFDILITCALFLSFTQIMYREFQKQPLQSQNVYNT